MQPPEYCEIEDRWIQSLRHSPIGIARVSLEGQFLEVNDSLCKMLGYSENELTTKTFQQITHPEDLEKDLAKVRLVLKQDINDYVLEKRYFHKNGSVIWVDLYVTLIRDYYKKPFYFIAQIVDKTKEKLLIEQLEKLTLEDDLTKLSNRRAFVDRELPKSIDNYKRYGTTFSVLFIDVDKFKLVNDRYGHQFGDLVLKEIASRLKSSIRVSDTAARLGGDEFAVLLPNTNESDAVEASKRLDTALDFWLESKGNYVHISCSIGHATINDKLQNADEILKKADNRMYRVKNGS